MSDTRPQSFSHQSSSRVQASRVAAGVELRLVALVLASALPLRRILPALEVAMRESSTCSVCYHGCAYTYLLSTCGGSTSGTNSPRSACISQELYIANVGSYKLSFVSAMLSKHTMNIDILQ